MRPDDTNTSPVRLEYTTPKSAADLLHLERRAPNVRDCFTITYSNILCYSMGPKIYKQIYFYNTRNSNIHFYDLNIFARLHCALLKCLLTKFKEPKQI